MNPKRMLFFLFVTLCVAQALSACGAAATSMSPTLVPTTAPPVPTATPEPVDPAAIAKSFYQAYNAGDLEALMALIAEDVQCRAGCYLTGKDRFLFYIQADLNQGFQAEISDLKVEGDKVTYNVTVYNNGGSVLISGVETLHIKDGLIFLID